MRTGLWMAMGVGLGLSPLSCVQNATCEERLLPCGPVRDAGVDSAETSIQGDRGQVDAHEDVSFDGTVRDAVSAESDAPDDVSDAAPLEAEAASAPAAIFVSVAGADTNDGTMEHPLATLAKAALAAKSRNLPVRVCAGERPYLAPLVLDQTLDGLEISGGFDCSDWSEDATKKPIIRSLDGARPALQISELRVGVTISNMTFEQPDATVSGGSSIAGILANNTGPIVLRNVTMVSGRGAPGAAGVDGQMGVDGVTIGVAGIGDAAPPGDAGQSGEDLGGKPSMCDSPPLVTAPKTLDGGAWAEWSACGSLGGKGGGANKGQEGYSGLAGRPQGSPNGGAAGKDGTKGDDGVSGGPGAAAPSSGRFGPNGYTPDGPGGTGLVGGVGQGGGGGGATTAVTVECVGASGGAGGMGGCGGAGGTGGGSGGASVALLSWASSVELDGCILLAGMGGAGGRGGNGGVGGNGGDGAPGGATSGGYAGHGGRGGTGGRGGAGAGGNGGPSYALVWKATKPTLTERTQPVTGTAGTKGLGGSAPLAAPDGADGDSKSEYEIP